MPGRGIFLGTALSTAMLVGAVPACAAPWSENPDWPCQQRLVPKLAAASYWSGPPLGGLGDWHGDPEVADLVRRIAPRQVSTEEGLSEIAAFAHSLSSDRARRLALIGALKEIGRRQRELAGLVAHLGVELNAIPSGATGDAAAKRIDLQQRYDFSARNFEEIQRTVRYACEAPVALDARLGAWARALEKTASG
jgi:hypothetical protein